MRSHTGKYLIKAALMIAVLATISSYTIVHQLHERHFPKLLRGFAVDPKPIGQVQLIDKTGRTLLSQNFKGKWTLVFFGYTNCPDVCPSTLLQLEQLKKALVKNHDDNRYQFLFVTVDPRRDTQTRLKEYVNYFDSQFDAAGGDILHIKTFEKVFGAFHQYEKKSKDDMHYSVAHSAEIYIVDPDARFVGKFLPPFDINNLTHKLTALSAFIQQKGNNA